MDSDPVCLREELRIVRALASQLDESARPSLQVIEVGGGRSGNDTIEIFGVHLCRLEALSTASRAANVVGILRRCGVELFNDSFARKDGGVTSAVHPVDDELVGAAKPAAVEGGSVMAGIVSNSSKSQTGHVVHVDKLDTSVDTAIVGAHRSTVPLGLAFG